MENNYFYILQIIYMNIATAYHILELWDFVSRKKKRKA